MLWAIREIPNATTEVSPNMMVYGRVPRGPLAVLKESWAGERKTPPDLGKPVDQYLRNLKAKLENGSEYTKVHTEKEQSGYMGHYNLWARHMIFHEGGPRHCTCH